ncbi:MAG: hypothetical protein HUN04_12845 [Desulfobacter sp.]|nr:MAG: hypothetical protein HUN04_12845 [Desulfobacter sp.]
MSSIPSRDISGTCDGECRNLVREGEESRQACIESVAYSIEEAVPSVSWASSRNVAPGFFGGHV